MRVAVIGAGAAGVACARHVAHSDAGHTCVVYEQNGQLGGTWVYDERTGENEYGVPIHTSMYKSLRTNLPKEIMGFPEFPIPKNEESYIPAKDILKLIDDYATHYNVKQHIKFHRRVLRVHPRGGEGGDGGEGGGWEVTVRDVRTGEDATERFDAVMVCNGHYWKPYIPTLAGAESFSGEQLHSHDYRTPLRFRGRRVLVIGAGPSGMDLTLEIASAAEHVIMSHHHKEEISTVFPNNVEQRYDVARLNGDTVEFVDGTSATVDTILYATGFLYDFPFLSEACGVRVEHNHVRPLYKHLIHVDHPTLCFVGLPFYVCAFLLFDLQARFFLRTLEGRVRLPSRQAMLADAERDQEQRRRAGLGPRQAHMLGPMQGDYYDELADFAGLPRVPPVMAALHNESSSRFLEDLVHYRSDIYRIVDDSTFLKVK
ncbi:hypothetical protein R5R35_003739 [Gryllus longicercus]|uniref:Flavin-containing monooxygenase n=1 Tax=Gryllus longicercus TaxID=2509291 RepID=A0AAN9Z6U2_9ORTH